MAYDVAITRVVKTVIVFVSKVILVMPTENVDLTVCLTPVTFGLTGPLPFYFEFVSCMFLLSLL